MNSPIGRLVMVGYAQALVMGDKAGCDRVVRIHART